jgi:hypothetical protein
MLNLIRAVLGIHRHRFNLSVKRSSADLRNIEPDQVIIEWGARRIAKGPAVTGPLQMKMTVQSMVSFRPSV